MTKQLDQLYAWVMDEEDEEGIIAAPIGNNVYPLITSRMDLAQRMKEVAARIVKEKDTPARLVSFSRDLTRTGTKVEGVVLDSIEPT